MTPSSPDEGGIDLEEQQAGQVGGLVLLACRSSPALSSYSSTILPAEVDGQLADLVARAGRNCRGRPAAGPSSSPGPRRPRPGPRAWPRGRPGTASRPRRRRPCPGRCWQSPAGASRGPPGPASGPARGAWGRCRAGRPGPRPPGSSWSASRLILPLLGRVGQPPGGPELDPDDLIGLLDLGDVEVEGVRGRCSRPSPGRSSRRSGRTGCCRGA